MDFSNSRHVIVTGSLDCLIRVWNPFVPKKPSFVLAGHTNAVIQLLLLGEEGKKLFSLDKAKCIKIWNMHTQDCMQTLLTLPADLGERAEISTIYQPETKEVVVCSMKIAVVVVFGEQDAQETDGYTHTEAVSVILYNPLFKVLISCGLESSIISWDPFTGKSCNDIFFHFYIFFIAATGLRHNMYMKLLTNQIRLLHILINTYMYTYKYVKHLTNQLRPHTHE